MEKLVSVIIPAYNCADYLELTIESIREQTWKSIEIVLVDDGSTDGTPALIDRLAASNPDIIAVHQPNGKQGKARNNGIRHSKGEFVAFLDADDLWAPEKLELQLQFLGKQDVDLVFTDGYICLENDMSRRDTTFQTLKGKMEGQAALRLFYESNRIPTSSVLCKRKALVDAGFFDESADIQNCEDYLLWVTMLNKGLSFFGMEEKLLYYRIHSGASTSQEVNLLFPLINALYKFDETPNPVTRKHLLLKYRRLVELLNENDQLERAETLIKKFSRKLTRFPFSFLITMWWSLNKRVFNSVFWRVVTYELRWIEDSKMPNR